MEEMMTVTVRGHSYRLWTDRTPSGLIIATCPDVYGLQIVERTWEEVAEAARALIPILTKDTLGQTEVI